MLKLVDKFLYHIIDFFPRENIFLVWLLLFNIVYSMKVLYILSNGQDLGFGLEDLLIVSFFLISYLRTRYVLKKIEKPENEKD